MLTVVRCTTSRRALLLTRLTPGVLGLRKMSFVEWGLLSRTNGIARM